MIGTITGQSVEKNRDGENNVRMLQVTIYTDDNAESVQLARPLGEDSNPVNGSRIITIPIGNAYKIGIMLDDGIEPSVDQGEKEFYSIVNGAKGATLKLDKNGKHIFNNGANDAARKNDQIQSTSAYDAVFWAWVTTISAAVNALAPGSVPTVPTSLTGKITQGTDKVQLP